MTAMPIVAPCNASTEALSRPENLASVLAPPVAAAGIVIACDGRDAQVACNGGSIAARVAFSCLVRPEPGDRVLTSREADTVWILAVLDRPTDAPARMVVEGDIAITSARGSISLLSAQEVTIDAGIRARVTAQEIDLHAGVARFVIDELQQIGRRANLYVAKIRSVGEMVETFAEHILTRAKRGTRFIEESDQLRAGSVDHRAEGTLQLRAKTAFITADTVVRVDADQIHMG